MKLLLVLLRVIPQSLMMKMRMPAMTCDDSMMLTDVETGGVVLLLVMVIVRCREVDIRDAGCCFASQRWRYERGKHLLTQDLACVIVYAMFLVPANEMQFEELHSDPH